MSLKLNIRALRKDKGLTLAELADMIGVSTPHLSEVERGVKNLNNHLIAKLSAALGVRPEALISDEVDQNQHRLAEMLDRLDEEDRNRVISFAQALLQSRRDGPQS